MAEEKEKILKGRYRLLGKLGRGAMGVVFLAHDAVMDRRVAIKILRLPEDLSSRARDEAVQRFYREARLAGKLIRPNIVATFGIARSVDSSTLTQTGYSLGTPQYMSPEQVRGEALDPRSDLFSLGVVLHEMLGGSNPFAADTPPTAIYNILEREPPPLGGKALAVPGLENVLAKALSRDVNSRYRNAEEMARDLDDIIGASVPSRKYGYAPRAPERRSRKARDRGVLAEYVAGSQAYREAKSLVARSSATKQSRLSVAFRQNIKRKAVLRGARRRSNLD